MEERHDRHKNKSKMILRRWLSMLLVFCMVFTFISAQWEYSFAAEDRNMADMDALSALGIDTGAVPEGFDENDTSNPYGKDTVTINPVEELHVFGLDGDTSSILKSKVDDNPGDPAIQSKSNTLYSKIYGHEDRASKSTENIINKQPETSTIASGTSDASGKYKYLSGGNSGYYLQPEEYSVSTTLDSFGKIAATKIAQGNFDGNREGKTGQNVLVYTGEFNQNGGLYMRIGDAMGSNPYGDPMTLIPAENTIGNPKEMITDVKEDFATDPYLMQNYLQVTTGDYDGDGIDEIAVFIPELNGSRIVVYKLKQTTGKIDYKAPDQWTVAWTYSLKESGYVSNMVSLVSGDFNKDGIDDLGATWGYYYGPDQNKGSKAVVMFGGKGNMLQKSQEFDLTFDHPKYGPSPIVRGSFIFGDLVGSGEEVLVLGGQSAKDIENGNLNSRYIATYTWNGKSFVPNIEKNFDLFEKDKDENYTYSIMTVGRDDKEVFYSSPSNPANLAVIKQGLSEAPYLYLDSLQIQYRDEELKLIAPLDLQIQKNEDSPVYYVEYGVTTGDMIGLGYDTLITLQQTLSKVENIGSTSTSWYYKSWLHKLFGIRTYESSNDSTPMFIPGETYMHVMDFKEAYLSSKEVDYSTAICMQNTDDDTSYLKYTGKHYFTYSDPQVLAVLASPPYFSDLLDRDDLSGNYGESTTSYSSTTGEGGGDTFNTTIEAGAYVSFEQDISVFGVKVASVEAEVALTAGFTYETESTSMLEQTVSYSATAGEDMIAFFSIPLEIYEYTAFTPNGDGDYSEQAMTVSIPRTAAVQMINLDTYEDIAKDYDILPKISGEILTHTMGDPFTYSSSTSGYTQPLEYSGDWARVGYSSAGAGITQEIAMTKEESKSYNFSGKIETKAGAGAGGVIVGVTVGAEVGGGWVNITTSGNSFSGEITNMPVEAEEYGYSHIWKIFSYLYDNGGMKFPIVNYLVGDVVAPPPLPKDFEQNTEKTTDTQIAFTWTYDKLVAGFQIYRYYEFPDGSGSYELKFIPMTDGIYKDGIYEFEFIDEDLSPYTDYQYQIQTVRAAVPNNSIPSKVVSARTKTDVGYPQYKMEGLDTEGNLKIYPDSESTVKIIVENAQDYPAGISYQWQKYINGIWVDINGRTSNALTFKSSGVADQAIYRCRTNLIYFDQIRGEAYYISSYAPEFSTIYSKRTPKILEDRFKYTIFDRDDGKGKGLRLDIDLVSANTNHFAPPTGTVTFTVKGTDYNTDFTVDLKSRGQQQDGKEIATATKDILNLSEGVYEISAYYSGSRVFKSLTTPENITALIGESGYQLLLQREEIPSTSFIYGDEITPILKNYDGENPKGQPVDNADIEYEIYQVSKEPKELGLSGDSFPTPDVGRYVLRAKLEDGRIIEREFTVSQREITIKAKDRSNIGKGYVSQYPPELELESSQMAFNQKLEDLKLEIQGTDSAGKIIVLDDTTAPGNYTIIGRPSPDTPENMYKNYKITFIEGIYTIIGQKYDVTITADKYQGRVVGTIHLSNAPDGKGGEFSAGTELLFFATPYTGYEVDSWRMKTREGQEIEISSEWLNTSKTRLAYTMKDEAIDVGVVFKKSDTTLTVGKIGEGSIEINDPAFNNGAKVITGAKFQLTAIPEKGYTFKEWRIESGGSTVIREGTSNSDGSNVLDFTMGDRSTTIRAVFTRDGYTIGLEGDLEAVYFEDDGVGGKIERIVTSGAKIEGDQEVLVRVKTGYQLAENAQWQVNGGTVVGVPEEGYRFTITKDTTIAVNTVQQYYKLDTISENGSISVKIHEDMPVIPDGTMEDVAGGSRILFTAIPDHGYAFKEFRITGTDQYTEKDNVLTIHALGADITVEAIFVKSTDYKVTVDYGNRGKVNYILYDSYGKEVRKDVIETGAPIDVSHGDKITFNVSPDQGYMVEKWTVNGIVDDTRSRSKTLEEITEDKQIVIDIISQVRYTVNYSVGGGDGRIVSATSDGRTFESGDTDIGGNSKLVITADYDLKKGQGHMVDYWTLNGKRILNDLGTDFVEKELVIENFKSDTSTVDIKVYFTEYKGYRYYTEAERIKLIISNTFPYYLGEEPLIEIIEDEVISYLIHGRRLEVMAYPENGYRMVELYFIDPDTKAILDSLLFEDQVNSEGELYWLGVVPRIESTIKTIAKAKKIYGIEMAEISGGSLKTITTTEDSDKAIAGEKVILEQRADLDHRFIGWNVKQGDVNLPITRTEEGEFSFIMPEGDVLFSAEFEKISGSNVDIKVFDINMEAPGGQHGSFSVALDREGVDGYPISKIDGAKEFKISHVPRAYTDEYNTWPKTKVMITAKPEEDYRVSKWMVNGVTYTSPLDFPVSSQDINQLILEITEEKDLDILVYFEPIGGQILYDVDGEHGRIQAKIQGKPFISGNTIASPAELVFTAEADPRYEVEAWLVNGEVTQTGGDTFTYFADGEHGAKITVKFAREPFSVSYRGIHGEVISQEVMNGGSVRGDTEVTFTAIADPGYKFDRFEMIGGSVSTSRMNPMTMIINDDIEVTAHFVPSANSTIRYTVVGGNGRITAAKNGSSFSSGEFAAGNDTILFTAYAAKNYKVKHWIIDGEKLVGNIDTYSLQVSRAIHEVSVEFERIPKYRISIDVTGIGTGEIEAYVNGREVSIAGDHILVDHHDEVELIAIPRDDNHNATWSISDGVYEMGRNSVKLLDVVSDITAKVKFGVAELITVEAYRGSQDGRISVRAGYGKDLEPLNALDGPVHIIKGKTVEFTAVPEEVYMVQYWQVNDTIIDDLSNIITLVPETNVTAAVYFEPIIGYEALINGENFTITSFERIPDDVPLGEDFIRKNGTVVFTVAPEEGYYLKELNIFGVDCINDRRFRQSRRGENSVSSSEENGVYTITIERITKDIDYTIVAEQPVITIQTPMNGTITASYTFLGEKDVEVRSGDKVPAGAVLTLKASADKNYKLSAWGDFVQGRNGTDIQFTVPKEDFTISALFKKDSKESEPSSGGGGGGGGGTVKTYTISTIAGEGGRISPESPLVDLGGSKTFTIIPDEGYRIEDVLVNGKSVGAVSSYRFSNINKNSTIEARFVKITGVKPTPQKSMDYNDVKDEDWFADAVQFVVELGLFKGTAEGEFSPRVSMNRGMFVTVLGRLYEYMEGLSLKQPTDRTFDDVPLDIYYAPSVQWASENGIINGYEDGKFKPDEAITREQIVVILHRFAAFTGMEIEEKSDLTMFSDHEDISQWAVGAVAWAVDAEIMGGRTDGTIDPTGLAQRAEVAAILHRFVLRFVEWK